MCDCCHPTDGRMNVAINTILGNNASDRVEYWNPFAKTSFLFDPGELCRIYLVRFYEALSQSCPVIASATQEVLPSES